MITLKNGREIELNQAFNMDCLEFMKMLPDKCIDLVLTDPPYGKECNLEGGSSKSGKNGWSGMMAKASDWNYIPDKIFFDELKRISKNQIIWGANYFIEYLSNSQGWLVWNKGQRNFSLADGELAYTSFNKALRIFDYARAKAMQDGKIHPTQKPVNLFRWCLKNNTKENQIIFDPFLGSFTTAIACDNLNINWLGCEKDPDYFKSGYHRYEQETKQQLFEF